MNPAIPRRRLPGSLDESGRRVSTPGVFTLDQLARMGQTGDMAADWLDDPLARPDPDSLIAGGGRAVVPTGIPAGYYRLPGMQEATYYDPHWGKVSPDFAKWATTPGGIERGPITDVPLAFMGGAQDSGDVFRSGYSQQVSTIKTLEDIFRLGRDRAGTYQDAQDRVLGIGRYQQFVRGMGHAGGEGKQIRMEDVAGFKPIDPATAPYTDLSALKAGAFDRLMSLTGKTRPDLEKELGMGAKGADYELTNPYVNEGKTFKYADYWRDMADALAANYETRARGQEGLREVREARGLDPETGISVEEKKRISDVYGRVSDPKQKEAFIKYQDPGNLTPELRAQRYEARAGERALITDWEASHPNVEYNYTGKFGQPPDTGAKLTRTSQIMTDKVTGRETFVANVPSKLEGINQNRGDFDRAARTFGGAVYGGMVGFATGGIPGAFLGAYMGGGGPLPNFRKTGFKDMSGLKSWRSYGPRMMSPQEVGTSLAFARTFRTGAYARG